MVLRRAGMVGVRRGRPLPLSPSGSSRVNGAVDLLETGEGGVVFLYGMAAWCWEPDDVVGRRLAAVQLVLTGAALPGEVARAFGVAYESLRRWRERYLQEGVEGLFERRRGPKGPIKLDEEMVARIGALSKEGMGLRAIGRRVGVDPSTVRRALGGSGDKEVTPGDKDGGGALVALARPPARTGERELARAGLLGGAEPLFCEGSGLPFVGSLLVLPAVAATGLLEAFETLYAAGRAAFYSVRSLVLTVVFLAVLGRPRAEGLTRLDPVDLGRLIGLGRAPEVRTLRLRLEELAQAGRADRLVRLLAEQHLRAAERARGLFYVDGYVRAYHGSARLPKAHVARARLSAPAEVDTWIGDERGEGLLVWTSPPGASLVGELKTATEEIRCLVGPQARPTVVFDRGGWSPKTFAELYSAGFDVLTYRKQPLRLEARNRFSAHEMIDDLGRRQSYLLADRRVSLEWTDDNRKKRHLKLRQVTRLDPDSGHQTQIVTTRTDLTAAEAAYAMFCRWRQENFFRYMRVNLGLDALDSYAKTADDPARSMPNPAKKAAQAAVREAKKALETARAEQGRVALSGGRTEADTQTIRQAFAAAQAELERRRQAARDGVCRRTRQNYLNDRRGQATGPGDPNVRSTISIRSHPSKSGCGM